VELRNDDLHPIQLSGWTLWNPPGPIFEFPGFVMQPGQVCRVYTNEYHPEWCGFNYHSTSAIWDDNGVDCALLIYGLGRWITSMCYHP
jgi:hypothetical protein